jgi:hypothetical protein
MVDKQHKQGINSLIILVATEVWKQHNGCVFNGDTPNVSVVLRLIADEAVLWCTARVN